MQSLIYLYNVLITLAIPLLFLRLLWKSRKLPAYKERWGERLAIYPASRLPNLQDFKADLWIHAVSLGETIAGISLVRGLLQAKNENPLKIIFTTLTPTGSAKIQAALPEFAGQVQHVYIPFDSSILIKRFIRNFQPKTLLILETEIWPNMILSAKALGLKVCIVNARLAKKSQAGYQKIKGILNILFKNIDQICVQSLLDQERYEKLGFSRSKIIQTGNIKYDLEIPKSLLPQIQLFSNLVAGYDLVWIAASTHAGEEKQILKSQAALKRKHPDKKILLILVPRHPERCPEVETLLNKAGEPYLLRSKLQTSTPLEKETVLLVDSIGELLLFYGISRIAFIGGSLVSVGGHNMLEAAVFGIPILTGQYLQNFAEISKHLTEAGALRIIYNAEELTHQLEELWQNPMLRQALGSKAEKVIFKNQGALNKTLKHIGYVI
ncbi:MAG: lipid IV(A) 3-deoxy-D-manno-octulosonic acid transferase [Gammaproteobacteria bacterium]